MCSGVRGTSITTIFDCILKILMLRFLPTPSIAENRDFIPGSVDKDNGDELEVGRGGNVRSVL